MSLRIRNWGKFQHFKDRRPPWIKLYRDLLDDREWHELDPAAAKVMIMLWLIASEDDGNLPGYKDLAFRLRMTESHLKSACSKLSHWLEQDDTESISPRYRDDAPETETERETEKETERAPGFANFWSAYPRKSAKPAAERAFRKLNPDTKALTAILAGIERDGRSDQWLRDDGKFIPHPATYLNQRRWEDEAVRNVPHGPQPPAEPTRSLASVGL